MTGSEWKDMMEGLLNGVEGELRGSVPVKTREVLNAFRMRLREARAVRRRKRFERDLEDLLQSNPLLRSATERHLRYKTISAIEEAEAVLRRAEPYLAKKARGSRETVN